MAYELTYGAIPEGAVVRHTCHQPTCCRPDHLKLGTQRDNVHDAIEAGRMNYARGERIPLAKFTDAQAAAICEVFTAMRKNAAEPKRESIDKLARALNVNARTVWRVVTNRAYQDVAVDGSTAGVLQALRRQGFPWQTVLDVEEDPIARVRNAKLVVEHDIVTSVGSGGQATCLQAHPHRFAARHRGQLSLIEAFNDDATLTRAIQYQQRRGDPTTPASVVRALQALVRSPRNFPPALARWIVDEYAPEHGTVLDPCSGYGGRLLGAIASTKNVCYIGRDINPDSVRGNQQLAQQLKVDERVTQTLASVLDDDWPSADLIFTSPPYFNIEDYSNEPGTETYESWRDGFLTTLIARALAAAPRLVLNVAAVGEHDLPTDAVRIAEVLGGRIERMLTWPLRSFGRGPRREEKILVFRCTL
jgi:hypothetical protein